MQRIHLQPASPLLALLGVLLLVLSLGACASQPAAPAASTDAEPVAAEADAEAHSAEEDHAHSAEEDHAHSAEEDHAHSAEEDHAHSAGEMLTAATIAAQIASLEPIVAGETLNVVATTNIVGDVVGQVGGDAINLTTLIPIGVDPHTFEATPRDIAAVAEADVVFVNGYNMEEALMPLIEQSGIDAARIIPVSVGIETREFAAADEHSHDEDAHSHDEDAQSSVLDLFVGRALAHGEEEHADEDHSHDHGSIDPHTWMDPNNVMVWVDNIVLVLTTLDPANADTFTANGAAYAAELAELDAFIREQIASIPEGQREMVTDHRAFGYYTDEYGLAQIGAVVPAYSTLAEPSAGDLAELQAIIAEHNVPAIFVGTTVNPDLAEQIASDLGIRILPIYTGSLSAEGEVASTYLDMIRYNTQQIVFGLTGS